MTRDEKPYREWAACKCGRVHSAHGALECGRKDTSDPHNYIMTDPDHFSEEIHAASDELAIAQLVRWAEIDGCPYTGTFTLHGCDEDGNTGLIVHMHESRREGYVSMDTERAKLDAYGYFFELYRTHDPAKKSPELEIIASSIGDRVREIKSAIATGQDGVKDKAAGPDVCRGDHLRRSPGRRKA